MTNKEYSDLREKIEGKKNNYTLWSTSITTNILLFVTMMVTQLIEKKGALIFWGAFVVWTIAMVIVLHFNPWKNKVDELDKLFKTKSSYKKAKKSLKLNYKPPKEQKDIGKISWISRIFLLFSLIFFFKTTQFKKAINQFYTYYNIIGIGTQNINILD